MRFSTRTFLFSSAPTIALLIAAFFFIENLTVSALTNDAKRSLRQTQLTIAHSRARSEAESVRLLKIVSENAPLKAAMQLMALERGSPDAKRTLEDQLREICVPLDLGFLSVSYPDGRFMAGMIRTAGRWTPLEPGRLSPPASGFVWDDAAVYTVTANRVTQAGEDLGQLSVGRTFDLAEVETPAVLMHGNRVLLSAVPAIPGPEIERGLEACKGRQDCQLQLSNANYLITKLDGSWNSDSCALISLENLDKATGPVAARLRSIFVTAGIGALGVALLGSLLSARAIVQPLAVMISHLRASERSGDLREFDFGPGAVREVGELTESFNRAASAIRKSKEDLQGAYLQFTGSLANALDARDSYAAGHSHRVSEYSCAIAEGLGLSAQEVGYIRIGALLHDIGKIGVSDSVLQKPGRLTGEEFALIQRHPTIGRRILEGVNGFQPYLAVVELHHENWDGTGYPRGLSGEEVPLAARIVHVADAFDAMTSDRPYRRGMSVSEAFSILNRFAGTQFDPEIVGAFLNLGLGTSGLMRLLENVSVENALELKTA
jgi:HD-GYP domain-containing protein (c-di-GMP phosphodiesterase class II)